MYCNTRPRSLQLPIFAHLGEDTHQGLESRADVRHRKRWERCVGMCMRSSCLCFDASAIPWCTETWRKNKGFLKRSFFLTKPLILGIGASKVLPNIGPEFHHPMCSPIYLLLTTYYLLLLLHMYMYVYIYIYYTYIHMYIYTYIHIMASRTDGAGTLRELLINMYHYIYIYICIYIYI